MGRGLWGGGGTARCEFTISYRMSTLVVPFVTSHTGAGILEFPSPREFGVWACREGGRVGSVRILLGYVSEVNQQLPYYCSQGTTILYCIHKVPLLFPLLNKARDQRVENICVIFRRRSLFFPPLPFFLPSFTTMAEIRPNRIEPGIHN